MQRELKFRHYDIHKKIFFDDSDMYAIEGSMTVENLIDEIKKYYIVTQYSGLKDSKCTPIFEGDILETNLISPESLGKRNKLRMKVEFSSGMFGCFIDAVNITPEKKLTPLSVIIADERLFATIVIGNVFENKDLLCKEN